MIARALRAVWGASWRLAVGAAMTWTVASSLLALGWLMRDGAAAGRRALARGGGEAAAIATPGFFVEPGASRRPRSWLGGAIKNLRLGIGAGFALALLAAPHGVVMAVSWWAGWSNSFHKGHEAAGAGPAAFLAAMVVAAMVFAYAPMAIAHAAWRGRGFAAFEFATVCDRIRRAPFGALALAIATAVLTAPLTPIRGAPVFVEQIAPGFADMSAEAQAGVAAWLRAVGCLYLFSALWAIRRLGGRIYARAALSAGDPEAVALAGAPRPRRPIGAGGTAALWIALTIIGLAAPVWLVLGQFLNHSWTLWWLHPFLAPPWTPSPG